MIRKEILELEFSDALITIYKYLNERGRVLIEGDPNGIELTPQEMIDFGHEIAAMGYDLIEVDDVDIDDSKEEEEWKVGDTIRITKNISDHGFLTDEIVSIDKVVLPTDTDKSSFKCISVSGFSYYIIKEEGEKVYE